MRFFLTSQKELGQTGSLSHRLGGNQKTFSSRQSVMSGSSRQSVVSGSSRQSVVSGSSRQSSVSGFSRASGIKALDDMRAAKVNVVDDR